MFSYSSCFFVYISAFNGRSSQNFLFVAITYVIQLLYVLLKQAISRCIKFQKVVDGVHWKKVMILNLTFYCFQTPTIQVTYMSRQYVSTVLGWNMKWHLHVNSAVTNNKVKQFIFNFKMTHARLIYQITDTCIKTVTHNTSVNHSVTATCFGTMSQHQTFYKHCYRTNYILC
jgi:hypothetical protein